MVNFFNLLLILFTSLGTCNLYTCNQNKLIQQVIWNIGLTKIIRPRNSYQIWLFFPPFYWTFAKLSHDFLIPISSVFFWVIILLYFISDEFASIDYFFLRLCFNLDSLIDLSWSFFLFLNYSFYSLLLLLKRLTP